MLKARFRWAARTACIAASAVALLTIQPGALPAEASEALGDLHLELRLVELTPAPASRPADVGGVATLDVVLQAYRGAEDIRLRILKPDGTPWTLRATPFDPGVIRWATPDGGEPLEAGGHPSVGASGALHARIQVPLEGAAIHEVVVEIVAQVGGKTERTENVARIALGVPMWLPVVGDDGVASFPLEVRP